MSSTAIARKRAEISQPLRPLAPLANQQRITPPTVVLKRPRTLVACETCKARRTKCTGQTPKCTRCGRLGLKCDYSDHVRLKKRGSIREARLLYENKIEKYKTILNCIRDSNTPFLNRLLARLHTDGSLEDILLFIRDEWSAAPITEASSICTDSTSFEHTIAGVREPSEAAAFDPNLVGDRPFIRGDAKTWTTVTDDDVLISHLISSYITWEVNTTPCVDMEIFLAAMEAGDNTLCSPLLVNSILAQGSYHMIGLSDRYEPHSPRYLHHLFFQEALRLWQEENSTALSIATAQAGLVLFRLMCCYDLDTVAFMTMDSILAIIARCVSEIGHSTGRTNGGLSQEQDRKIQKLIAVTQRAAFASQCLLSSLKDPPMLSPPDTSPLCK